MQFKDKDIEAFWLDPETSAPKRVSPKLRHALYRKLQMLSAAYTLNDLRVPPSNHLEKLQKDRKDYAGKHSICVNKQWRLVFRWDDGEAKEVEFCDYH